MKRNLILLILALLIALPIFGIATETAAPATPEVQETETAPTAPPSGPYGPRWRQFAPGMTAPQTGFVDEDNDGLCDNCGSTQGKNADAPGFIDENNDGVCDHFGTDEQGQGQGRMQAMQSRRRQMMERRQGVQNPGRRMMGGQSVQGRGRGMAGRGVQGNARGRNYQDDNNDGVCDRFDSSTQRNFGCGGNCR